MEREVKRRNRRERCIGGRGVRGGGGATGKMLRRRKRRRESEKRRKERGIEAEK